MTARLNVKKEHFEPSTEVNISAAKYDNEFVVASSLTYITNETCASGYPFIVTLETPKLYVGSGIERR